MTSTGKTVKRGKAAEEKKRAVQRTTGYGLATMVVAANINLLDSLIAALGFPRAVKLMALASFLCTSHSRQFGNLADFCSSDFGFALDGPFGESEVSELLNGITEKEIKTFYKGWIPTAYDEELDMVVLDARSCYCGMGEFMTAAPSPFLGSGNPPLYDAEVFIGQDSIVPMFVCSHWGRITDHGSLQDAHEQAKGVGIEMNAKNTIIVTDAVPVKGRLSFPTLKGRRFICKIPIGAVSEVDDAFFKFSKSVKPEDEDSAWPCTGSYYLSSSVPMRLGGVDGELALYWDLYERASCSFEAMSRYEGMHDALKGTKRAPKTGFAGWARSFEPFFHVCKAENAAGFKYEAVPEALDRARHMGGACAIFTSDKHLDEEEILSIYKSKGLYEISFDTARNHFGELDLREPESLKLPVASMRLAMFVSIVLSLCMTHMLVTYIGADNDKAWRIDDAELELSKVAYTREGGRWRPEGGMTDVQKRMFQALVVDENSLDVMDEVLWRY